MQPAYPNQSQPYPYYNPGYYNNIPPPNGLGVPSSYPLPYGGAGGYPAPRPHNTPYAPAFNLPPGGGGGTGGSTAGQTPAMPRPQHLVRPPTPGVKSNTLPRKSALKNGTKKTDLDATVPLVRTRTTSMPRQNMPFIPHHIFMSFRGSNEFLLDNVPSQVALDEIRQEIFPLWDVDFNDFQGSTWRVRFKGSPWGSSGSEAVMAWKIITALFKLLAKRGYNYLTSVNTTSTPPRLTFIVATTDESADFFIANFSNSGRRVTIVNPPHHIGNNIVPALKAAMPHMIAGDRVSKDNVHVIELKRHGTEGPPVDKTLFMTHVLKQIHMMGYKLEAAIPMARKGLLGLGRRKELLVFRGSTAT